MDKGVELTKDILLSDPWPPLRGDYSLGDDQSTIAVTTLALRLEVLGAAICGPCKTENLGVEKMVANLISNSKLRFLLVCGPESKGHLPGDAIIALHRNGLEESGRIAGARGAIPYIENLPREAVVRFQRQFQVIDRRGLEDISQINMIIEEHRREGEPYPEPPYLLARKRAKHAANEADAKEGDVFLGAGLALESSAWIVGLGKS
jgi:tetrahydromethanopterin S-methyltransferase subunit A